MAGARFHPSTYSQGLAVYYFALVFCTPLPDAAPACAPARSLLRASSGRAFPLPQKINGKETGKGEIWDGEWYGGNSEAPGWEGMPDTAALPRLPDGSLVQYTNILTKEEWDPTFLPVDLEPEPDDIPDEQIIKFQELPGVPEEEDVVQWFMNWRAEGRIGFDYLKEGMELEGVVTEQHLYFGCVVDCGCEFEGLAWIDEDDWTEELGELIEVGTKVRVRVSGLFDRERFRFPLELQIVSPDITDYITYGPPDDRPMIFYADESDDVWEEEMVRLLGSEGLASERKMLQEQEAG